jgi:hypothetical protein
VKAERPMKGILNAIRSPQKSFFVVVIDSIEITFQYVQHISQTSPLITKNLE